MATCVVCTYTKCGMIYNTSIWLYTKCGTLYNTSIWAYPKCVIIYNTSIWTYTKLILIFSLWIPGTKNVSVSLFVNMALPIYVSHVTKIVSISLFFNTIRISDKKFTCAAGNHATSQFTHKKKLTAQSFGPMVGLPVVNWSSCTSLQLCPSKPCNLVARFKKKANCLMVWPRGWITRC